MKSLRYAIAVALALPSATVLALQPGEFDGNTPRVLRVGGATASDNTLRNLFSLNSNTNAGLGVVGDPSVVAIAPCVRGTVDIYYSGNVNSPADYIISCQSRGTVAGMPAGSHIVIVKETAGGSANGILNVARQTALTNFITPTGANLGGGRCVADPPTPDTALTMSVRRWDCDATLSGFYTPAAPHVGISDVDPTTFVGTAGVTLSDAGALLADPSIQVVFGPIISVALRNRLQDIQYGAACDDPATERETLACIPSLPSSVLAGIFSDKIDDWNQVEINGTRVGAAYGDQPARVCRRQDTSGTQTSFKLHYLNQGCNTNASANSFVGTLDAPTCSTTQSCGWNPSLYGTHRVFAGGSSGNVRDCVNFNSTTEYRLGVASTEARPDFSGSATANRFRYIRVDGQEATLWATQEGRYNFFTENTLNTRNSDVTPALSQPIWTFIRNNIGQRAAVVGTNSGFTNAACTSPTTGACDTGVMIQPVQYEVEPIWPLAVANLRDGVDGGPVNSQSRTLPGDPPNNCNIPFRVLPGAGL